MNIQIPKCLYYKMSIGEKIKDFWGSNSYAKALWLFHWQDTYGKHLERYYNSKWFQKRREKVK